MKSDDRVVYDARVEILEPDIGEASHEKKGKSKNETYAEKDKAVFNENPLNPKTKVSFSVPFD